MESTSKKYYDQETLSNILAHPEAARKNPYWLFTTFFWHRLKDELYRMEYDEADPETTEIPSYDEFNIVGMSIDNQILKIMLEGSAQDFVSAMNNGMAVRILDKPYRVPKSQNVTVELLANEIFRFPNVEAMGDPDYCEIVKECIYEIKDKHLQDDQLMEIGHENQRSRIFFRKLVWLVEKTDDGWDKLTDMEAACYVWALQMSKFEGQHIKDVPGEVQKALAKINKDVGDFELNELVDCWVREYNSAEVSIDTQFSYTKMKEWAEANGQKSVVDRISEKTADDYWFIEGLKGFF